MKRPVLGPAFRLDRDPKARDMFSLKDERGDDEGLPPDIVPLHQAAYHDARVKLQSILGRVPTDLPDHFFHLGNLGDIFNFRAREAFGIVGENGFYGRLKGVEDLAMDPHGRFVFRNWWRRGLGSRQGSLGASPRPTMCQGGTGNNDREGEGDEYVVHSDLFEYCTKKNQF